MKAGLIALILACGLWFAVIAGFCVHQARAQEPLPDGETVIIIGPSQSTFQVRAAWPPDQRVTEICLLDQASREELQCCTDGTPQGTFEKTCTFEISIAPPAQGSIKVVGVSKAPGAPQSADSQQVAVFQFPLLSPTLLSGELEAVNDAS